MAFSIPMYTLQLRKKRSISTSHRERIKPKPKYFLQYNFSRLLAAFSSFPWISLWRGQRLLRWIFRSKQRFKEMMWLETRITPCFCQKYRLKMYIYVQLQILSKNSYHKVNVLREAQILEPNANPAFEADGKMVLVGFHSFLALNQSFIISVKLIISNNCSRKTLSTYNHHHIPASWL